MIQLGEKLAAFLGDKTDFGVGKDGPKQGEFSSQPSMLCNLLHYEAFNADTDIFYNKQSSGFILEASPLTGASEETVNILASIVTDILPEGADLQFLLWASNKVGARLDDFESESPVSKPTTYPTQIYSKSSIKLQ